MWGFFFFSLSRWQGSNFLDDTWGILICSVFLIWLGQVAGELNSPLSCFFLFLFCFRNKCVRMKLEVQHDQSSILTLNPSQSSKSLSVFLKSHLSVSIYTPSTSYMFMSALPFRLKTKTTHLARQSETGLQALSYIQKITHVIEAYIFCAYTRSSGSKWRRLLFINRLFCLSLLRHYNYPPPLS